LACQTDPNFPNTWFVPATNENEPTGEQTTTLTFGGTTFTHTGVFNVLDSDGTTISDQVKLVHASGGDKLVFNSDPFTPLAGGTTLATEGTNNGVVAPLNIGFTGGSGITANIGSDAEGFFNPIGIGGGQDLSDFVQVTPEPSTIALAVPGMAPFALVYLRRRKRTKRQPSMV
jgi:hypothetical protein